MQSNEEYLDSLLKAAMGSEEEMEHPKEEAFDPNKALSPEEIEAMFASAGEAANDDLISEEVQEEASIEDLLAEEVQEEASIEDLLAEEVQEETSIEDLLAEEVQEEASIENLLAEAEKMEGLEEKPEDVLMDAGILEEEPEEQPENPVADSEESLEELLAELGNAEELPEDLLIGIENEEQPLPDFFTAESGDAAEEPWDGLAGEDDEMAEINELLSQSDGGSMLDDDMLALLESMPESGESLQTEHVNGGESDEIDIFAMDAIDEEEEESQKKASAEQASEPPLEEKPVKKKEKKGWFGKRKKKKTQNSEESKKEGIEEELSSLEMTEEGLLDLAAINEVGEIRERDEIREKEPKKSGFFSNLMDFLLEEEEEEEEEPKKEKNKKEKKKPKKGKGPASEENEAILDELEEEDKKNKKKKKPKKVKKQPKEKKQEEPSKEDGKKLPKKMVIRIFVMCFSVMVLLLIPAMLLPELFSLRDARKAYYNEDYKTAYENLLGKNLNNSDSLMLEKATILMRLQRKYDSFINYHKMGKETEALNALLEGCNLYIQLQAEAQEQGISKELDEIHQDLLDNLEYLYGVTEDQAGVLISIADDAVYTEEVTRIAGSNEEITGGSVPAYRSDEGEQPEE